MSAIELCDLTALFGVFLETNKHQNLTRLRCPGYLHNSSGLHLSCRGLEKIQPKPASAWSQFQARRQLNSLKRGVSDILPTI